MNARRASVVLVLVSVATVAAALWIALHSQQVGATTCGPIITMGNRRKAACDDYFSTRYVTVPVLLGIAAVSYAASVIVERVAERRQLRQGG